MLNNHLCWADTFGKPFISGVPDYLWLGARLCSLAGAGWTVTANAVVLTTMSSELNIFMLLWVLFIVVFLIPRGGLRAPSDICKTHLANGPVCICVMESVKCSLATQNGEFLSGAELYVIDWRFSLNILHFQFVSLQTLSYALRTLGKWNELQGIIFMTL